jgi:hypothetical protein
MSNLNNWKVVYKVETEQFSETLWKAWVNHTDYCAYGETKVKAISNVINMSQADREKEQENTPPD